MAADGFASLTRDDAAMNVVFLRRGLESLPEDQRNTPTAGLILAFVVDDLECELTRLQAEGVTITMPPGSGRPSGSSTARPSVSTVEQSPDDGHGGQAGFSGH
jgi:hypothetical protein